MRGARKLHYKFREANIVIVPIGALREEPVDLEHHCTNLPVLDIVRVLEFLCLLVLNDTVDLFLVGN